ALTVPNNDGRRNEQYDRTQTDLFTQGSRELLSGDLPDPGRIAQYQQEIHPLSRTKAFGTGNPSRQSRTRTGGALCRSGGRKSGALSGPGEPVSLDGR